MGLKPRRPVVGRVEETWSDIIRWLADRGARQHLAALRGGASAARLAHLENQLGIALPADYVASLRCHDGGGDFESYEYLSADEVAARHRDMLEWSLPPDLWRPSWIPVAADSCGNLICLDARAGTSVQVELQGPQGAFPDARTWADFLAAYRDKLHTGELAVDDDGFVSEPITPPSVEPGERLERLSPELSRRIDALIGAGDLGGLLALIDAEGIDVNRQATMFDQPILCIAAEKKQTAIVRALLERGAEVDVNMAQGGRTPLFWSLWGMSIDLDLTGHLLEAGADPNAMTGYDGTPLHAAAMWSHRDAWDLLIARGADPEARDASGRTALESYRS